MSEWIRSGGSAVEVELFKVGDRVMEPTPYGVTGKIVAFAGVKALVRTSRIPRFVHWCDLKDLRKVHKGPVLRRA